MTRRWIWVKTQFHALHNWPECPIETVKFLRDLHRHTFHVTVKVAVDHHDRDIEFFVFQGEVETAIASLYGDKTPLLGRKSCEEIAEDLYKHLSHRYYRDMVISVSEDGEVGAEVEFLVDRAETIPTVPEWQGDI